VAQQPLVGQGLPLSRLQDHTQTHHNRYDSSGRVISPKNRPLPDNTQHSQEKDIHAPRGTRTDDPSERPQTHALARAATGIGRLLHYVGRYFKQHPSCALVDLITKFTTDNSTTYIPILSTVHTSVGVILYRT
jgi:hypothetical protein